MKEHQLLVERTVKDPVNILNELTMTQCHLIHMTLGISGEAGELLDSIKKHVIYQKPLDIENIIEELGDLEYYLQGLRAELKITREECLEHNIKKLNIRYPEKYSNEAARIRADKMR